MAIEREILNNAHKAIKGRKFDQLESAKRLLQILDEEKAKGFVDYPRESKSGVVSEVIREQIQAFQTTEQVNKPSSLDLLMDTDQSTTLTLSEFLKMRRSELSAEALDRGEPSVSQETLARRARVSLAWYQKIEGGRAPRVSANILLGIAAAMGLNENHREVFMKRFGPKI